MKTLYLALLACLPLAAAASEGNVSKVNGSVRVEAGQSAGDVSTVNGSVTIEEGATAEDVNTVNGSITIESNATVQRVESVNGGVSLGSGSKVQLRLEAFNLFNHTNFNQPDNFLGSPTFGQILSAQSPRRIQLGAKVIF
jgi:hypothetical protein